MHDLNFVIPSSWTQFRI